MKQHDLAITGGDVVIGDDVAKLNIGVRDGRISVISDQPIDAAETIDAHGPDRRCPGVIDEHFHAFGGYGWETYENATRGAAKGGVTSVVDMPLDKPATLTADRLRSKLETIRGDVPRRLRLLRRLPGGGPRPDGGDGRARRGGLQAVHRRRRASRHVSGRRRRARTSTALRRAAALGPAHHRPLRERADRRLGDRRALMAEGRNDMAAWDEARPWYERGGGRAERRAGRRGHRAPGGHRARQLAADRRRRSRAARARGGGRLGRDLSPLPLHHQGAGARDMRLKWNPPTREQRVGGVALAAASATVRCTRSARDHAPLPKVHLGDIWEQSPGAGNGVEMFFPVFAHRGAPPPRRADHPHLAARVEHPGDDSSDLAAQGRDRDRRRRRLRDRRDQRAARWSTRRSSSTTTRRSGRRSTASELKVYPVYTVLRGQVDLRRGQGHSASPATASYLSRRRGEVAA